MTKREFLNELKSYLSNMPSEDVNKYLEYYSEMIEDRIDDGMAEEDAVKEVGSPRIIAEQILKDNGATISEESYKESEKKENKEFSFKNLDTLSIILIIATFPVWIPLLAGVFSAVVGVLAGVLAIIISVWACAFAFLVGGIAGIIMGIISIFTEGVGVALCYIGAGILLIGLSVLFYIGAKYFTKLCTYLYKKCVELIKKRSKKVKNKVKGEA